MWQVLECCVGLCNRIDDVSTGCAGAAKAQARQAQHPVRKDAGMMGQTRGSLAGCQSDDPRGNVEYSEKAGEVAPFM